MYYYYIYFNETVRNFLSLLPRIISAHGKTSVVVIGVLRSLQWRGFTWWNRARGCGGWKSPSGV